MLPETAFSFADASVFQMIAFFGGAVAHIGFFAWVVWLIWR
jgi:hypothetical protein